MTDPQNSEQTAGAIIDVACRKALAASTEHLYDLQPATPKPAKDDAAEGLLGEVEREMDNAGAFDPSAVVVPYAVALKLLAALSRSTDTQVEGGGDVTDAMGRALTAEYRKVFPGAGWPSLETAKQLVRAALSRSTDTASQEELREAATALVVKLDVIHDDPRYQNVWTINQAHAGPYSGPNYTHELATLRAALATPRATGIEPEGADTFTSDDFPKHWAAFADADHADVPPDFIENAERMGLAELVPVDEDATEGSFAAERGINHGGMMWQLTAAGRARYVAALRAEPVTGKGRV